MNRDLSNSSSNVSTSRDRDVPYQLSTAPMNLFAGASYERKTQVGTNSNVANSGAYQAPIVSSSMVPSTARAGLNGNSIGSISSHVSSSNANLKSGAYNNQRPHHRGSARANSLLAKVRQQQSHSTSTSSNSLGLSASASIPNSSSGGNLATLSNHSNPKQNQLLRKLTTESSGSDHSVSSHYSNSCLPNSDNHLNHNYPGNGSSRQTMQAPSTNPVSISSKDRLPSNLHMQKSTAIPPRNSSISYHQVVQPAHVDYFPDTSNSRKGSSSGGFGNNSTSYVQNSSSELIPVTPRVSVHGGVHLPSDNSLTACQPKTPTTDEDIQSRIAIEAQHRPQENSLHQSLSNSSSNSDGFLHQVAGSNSEAQRPVFHSDTTIGANDNAAPAYSVGNVTTIESSSLPHRSLANNTSLEEQSFEVQAQRYLSMWRSAGSGFSPRGDVDEDTPLSSMCFSLAPGQGKVTSLVFTSDKAYCIAGFSSGTVRLFDLTVAGNTDPEDRFGYIIGSIKATSTQLGSMHLSLNLAENRITTPAAGAAGSRSSPRDTLVSHLFVGATMGCNSMLSIDLGSLRELKRERGFITTIGGGMHTFSHSDSRLKGCLDLATICVLSNGGDGNAGYTARYKLLCGQAYQSFCIWDVLIETTMANSRQPLPSAGGEASSSLGSKMIHYSDSWTICATGSVNGPSLVYGKLCCANPVQVLKDFIEFRSEPPSSAAAQDLFLSTRTKTECACEVLTRAGDRDLRCLRLDQIAAEKPTTVKITSKVRAASSDGSVLFSGNDELVIMRYMPISGSSGEVDGVLAVEKLAVVRGQIVSSVTFNLSGNNHHNARQSRHFREISAIHCTSDGSYALILCSDNTVLLYSPGDIFQRGVGPSSVSINFYNATTAAAVGFVTLLFQVSDTFKLELQISDIHSAYLYHDEEWRNELSRSRPASKIFIAVAWWPVASPGAGGVLRTIRLDSRGFEQGSFKFTDICDNFCVPKTITVSKIGLIDYAQSSSLETHCWLCGDHSVNHWDAAVEWENLDDEERMVTTNKSNNNARLSQKYDSRGNLDTRNLMDNILETKTGPNFSSSFSGPRIESIFVTSNNDAQLPGTKRKSEDQSDLNSSQAGDQKASKVKKKSSYPKESSNVDSGVEYFTQDEQLHVHESSSSSSSSSAPMFGEENTSAEIQYPQKSKSGLITVSKSTIDEYEARIAALKTSQDYFREQAELTVRKADRRFEEEKRLRKEWNVRKSEYLAEIAALRSELQPLKDSNDLLSRKNDEVAELFIDLENPVRRLLGLMTRTGSNTAGAGNAATQGESNATGRHDASWQAYQQQIPTFRAPFCVICQDHTADCVILDCGHVCLCREHAQKCSMTNQLSHCPVCKSVCNGVVPLSGLDRLP